MTTQQKVAVIGAGMSGLTVANKLKNTFDVTVFEKANRPGGRVTSKVINNADFDYGAQFFIAKTKAFQTAVDQMLAAGVVAIWRGHFIEFDHTTISSEREWNDMPPHYVGTPNMGAIGEWMAHELDVHYDTTISDIKRHADGWHVFSQSEELGCFDWLILTMPPKQVADLLSDDHPFQHRLTSINTQACFALRVVLKQDVDLGFNSALVRNHDISWISKNSSKPNRVTEPAIVVHATNNWADAHLDDELSQVKQHMTACLCSVAPISPEDIAYSDVKRWVYANTPKQSSSEFLIDSENKLAVCGDGFIHGRVESAYMSGYRLAADINNIEK